MSDRAGNKIVDAICSTYQEMFGILQLDFTAQLTQGRATLLLIGRFDHYEGSWQQILVKGGLLGKEGHGFNF